jgi:hypothetical protein
MNSAKATVITMYERATEVLLANRIPSNVFRVQFAVFRNYNSEPDKLLQYSSWATQPQELRAFLQTIGAEGGAGNEAVEIGLWHAANEAEKGVVSQVILIGDAPANTDQEIQRWRGSQSRWAKTPFKTPTNLAKELQRMRDRSIPVSAFYVAQRAKEAFEAIATTTGGECEFLDVNSTEGASLLTAFVTKAILKNVGGAAMGARLAQEYDLRYLRGHSGAGPERK